MRAFRPKWARITYRRQGPLATSLVQMEIELGYCDDRAGRCDTGPSDIVVVYPD